MTPIQITVTLTSPEQLRALANVLEMGTTAPAEKTKAPKEVVAKKTKAPKEVVEVVDEDEESFEDESEEETFEEESEEEVAEEDESEEESFEDDEEEEVAPAKKPSPKQNTTTSGNGKNANSKNLATSKPASKPVMKYEDLQKIFRDTDARLAGDKSSKNYAKKKERTTKLILAVIKKAGAKNTRTIAPEKYASVVKELKALV